MLEFGKCRRSSNGNKLALHWLANGATLPAEFGCLPGWLGSASEGTKLALAKRQARKQVVVVHSNPKLFYAPSPAIAVANRRTF